ncbi:tetratricopeptide repeat protein [Solwaraspora sp. WMMD1047]|uniref:tetratricopeptide repeat protein n=1 Tax=Solwaraspora sp. WMMD1047 TaxID=3016102 RepID=UPI002417FD98|nr:tetratricopeptide repeat protein [Solwaraspora sp. WMMD1047]MDG4832988.1 tetratricopeptide repeat protein [Solwaraspora sp. WMMD1047]
MRPWLTLLAASISGGAVGVLTAVWLPPWAAAALGTAGAGIAGIFSARAQDSINRAASREPERRRSVRDLTDPIVLGVHPAATVRGTNDSNRVPEFVHRDAYAELRERLREGGFVLLIGESTAGKSRLAFEAMRDELPEHRFHRPTPGQGFDGVCAAVGSGRQHVVWLDELDLYLGAGGLTVDAVDRLLAQHPSRHVVILATMRVREYDRYSARHRDASDAAVWRAGRDVLLLARNPLELPRAWSASELNRARSTTTDRRVVKAVAQAHQYGVAEFLAAGPELVADWQRAATVGDHPRGAALVAAAVDCRRIGVHRPIPLELLLSLHATYLIESANRLHLESVEQAIRWATTITYASSSLLTEVGDRGYLAFDYLIDQPFLPAVPEPSWTTLLGHVTPAEAYDVGWAAIDVQRPDHAISAFEQARRHHVANADYAYVLAWGNAGQAVAAAEQLRTIAADREVRLGPDHPDTLQAQHDHARYLGEAGSAAQAARILRHVGDRRAAVLGPDNPHTLTSKGYEAKFVGRSGDSESAIRMLTETAEQRRRILGDSHVDTLLVRIDIARYTAKAGRSEEAARHLAELLTEIRGLFGPDTPYSLSTRYEYARAVGDAGEPRKAIALLTELIADQQRILGPRHPRVLSTRHQLARFLGETGDPATAVRLFAELVNDRVRILGPDHARTIGSRLQHARFLADVGESQLASATLDEARRACVAALGDQHPLSRFAEHLAQTVNR